MEGALGSRMFTTSFTSTYFLHYYYPNTLYTICFYYLVIYIVIHCLFVMFSSSRVKTEAVPAFTTVSSAKGRELSPQREADSEHRSKKSRGEDMIGRDLPAPRVKYSTNKRHCLQPLKTDGSIKSSQTSILPPSVSDNDSSPSTDDAKGRDSSLEPLPSPQYPWLIRAMKNQSRPFQREEQEKILRQSSAEHQSRVPALTDRIKAPHKPPATSDSRPVCARLFPTVSESEHQADAGTTDIYASTDTQASVLPQSASDNDQLQLMDVGAARETEVDAYRLSPWLIKRVELPTQSNQRKVEKHCHAPPSAGHQLRNTVSPDLVDASSQSTPTSPPNQQATGAESILRGPHTESQADTGPTRSTLADTNPAESTQTETDQNDANPAGVSPTSANQAYANAMNSSLTPRNSFVRDYVGRGLPPGTFDVRWRLDVLGAPGRFGRDAIGWVDNPRTGDPMRILVRNGHPGILTFKPAFENGIPRLPVPVYTLPEHYQCLLDRNPKDIENRNRQKRGDMPFPRQQDFVPIDSHRDWRADIDHAELGLSIMRPVCDPPEIGSLEFSNCIDHTLLDSNATKKLVDQLCQEAKKYNFNVSTPRNALT